MIWSQEYTSYLCQMKNKNRLEMNVLSAFISYLLITVFIPYTLQGQKFFSKTYGLDDINPLGLTLQEYEDNIYIWVGHRCDNYTKNCGSIVTINLEGDLLSEREISWLGPGNDETMNIQNDVISLSGHRNLDVPEIFVLAGFSINGDSLFHKEYLLPDSISGVLNYGLLETEDFYYINGAAYNPLGYVLGLILKINKLTLEPVSSVIRRDGALEFNIYDLVEHDDRIFFAGTFKTNPYGGLKKRTINELKQNGTRF